MRPHRRSRVLGFSTLLLFFWAALSAADWNEIPLSDRPTAPLLGIVNVTASRAGDLVLALYSGDSLRDPANTQQWIERFTIDGFRADPAPQAVSGITSLASDGSRWILATSGEVRLTVVERDGTIRPPHSTGLTVRDARLFDQVGGPILRTLDTDGDVQRLRLYRVRPDLTLELLREVRYFAGEFEPIFFDDGRIEFLEAVGPAILIAEPRIPGTVGPGKVIAALPPDTSGSWLIRSRDRGGLVLWSGNGLWGMLLTSDGSFSTPFRVADPIRFWTLDAVEGDDGWTVLIRDDQYRTQRIHVDRVGRVLGPDILPAHGALVPSAQGDLLISSDSPGIRLRKDAGSIWIETDRGAIGPAAQRIARVASAPGLDLVVWNEQAMEGRLLRATRVLAEGAPLDGAGLVVGALSSLPFSGAVTFDVVWDGSFFVIAWAQESEEGESLVVRRITPNGTLLDRDPITVAASNQVMSIRLASDEAGSTGVVWSDSAGIQPGPTRELRFALVRDGAPGPPVWLDGVGELGSPKIAWDGRRYVVLWDRIPPCRITCGYRGDPVLRAFDARGNPSTGLVFQAPWSGRDAELIRVGDTLFTMIASPMSIARVGDDLMLRPLAPAQLAGTLRTDGFEIFFDETYGERSVYSPAAGERLRYEPLPLEANESLENVSFSRFIVRTPSSGSSPQLVLRKGSDRVADVEVVFDGFSGTGPARIAWFRVRNLGPDSIERLTLDASSYLVQPSVSGWPQFTRFPTTLLPGQSTQVAMRAGIGNQRLRVLGDATDLVPENNETRSTSRRRAVAR